MQSGPKMWCAEGLMTDWLRISVITLNILTNAALPPMPSSAVHVPIILRSKALPITMYLKILRLITRVQECP